MAEQDSVVHSNHQSDLLVSVSLEGEALDLGVRVHLDQVALRLLRRTLCRVDLADKSRLHPVGGSAHLPVQDASRREGRDRAITDCKHNVATLDQAARRVLACGPRDKARHGNLQLKVCGVLLLLLGLGCPNLLLQGRDQAAERGVGVANRLVEQGVGRRGACSDPGVAGLPFLLHRLVAHWPHNGFALHTHDSLHTVNCTVVVNVCVKGVRRQRKLAKRPAGVQVNDLDALLHMRDQDVRQILGLRVTNCLERVRPSFGCREPDGIKKPHLASVQRRFSDGVILRVSLGALTEVRNVESRVFLAIPLVRKCVEDRDAVLPPVDFTGVLGLGMEVQLVVVLGDFVLAILQGPVS
mmetsp:Transcript_2596/g.6140  ORF Transcript_2596/g.6140 Transcript_2596/m.6140 type:complete len:354 (+) Transcript_2596:1041-2102(+)